jgi:mono/diheme cytochrome c family protein
MKQSKTILLLTALLVSTLVSGALLAQDPAVTERGEAVYNSRCVICHGPAGDGKGLMGVIHRNQLNGMVVSIYPRDFTAGMFKFRSTPSGYLPTDADLLRIVTEGIPRSGMPGHVDVPLSDRVAVVEYVKTFSPRWQRDEPGEPIEIASPPPSYVGGEESVARGEEMYAKARCAMCHGETGQGDGPSAATLTDSWGDKILPFDFTSGPLKGGSSAENVYRTFVTGLDGTPMPSYQDAIEEQDRWDLVSYCLELMTMASAE